MPPFVPSAKTTEDLCYKVGEIASMLATLKGRAAAPPPPTPMVPVPTPAPPVPDPDMERIVNAHEDGWLSDTSSEDDEVFAYEPPSVYDEIFKS